jgi:hypothetical protein
MHLTKKKVARLENVIIRFPRISVSYNTASVQLTTHETVRGHHQLRANGTRRTILRLAYRFASEEFLYPANHVDPFYIVKN